MKVKMKVKMKIHIPWSRIVNWSIGAGLVCFFVYLILNLVGSVNLYVPLVGMFCLFGFVVLAAIGIIVFLRFRLG